MRRELREAEWAQRLQGVAGEIDRRCPGLRDGGLGSRVLAELDRSYRGQAWPTLERATDAELLSLRNFGPKMLARWREFVPAPAPLTLPDELERRSEAYDRALDELVAAKRAWIAAEARLIDAARALASADPARETTPSPSAIARESLSDRDAS
jgi:hypothetical protein